MIKRRQSFTLIELLVTISVIAILSGLTIAGVRFALQRSEEAAIRSRLQRMEMALESYRRDWGYYPIQKEADADFNFALEAPNGAPYLEESTQPYRQAPNGTPFRYRYPGALDRNPQKYDLWAAGADEQWDTSDDITNWTRP